MCGRIRVNKQKWEKERERECTKTIGVAWRAVSFAWEAKLH